MNAPAKGPLCPRCRVPLGASIEKDWSGRRCRLCEGLWLDREALVRAREGKAGPTDRQYGEQVRAEVPYLRCVQCEQMMRRFNFANISGVLLDECGEHGVWLDRGELDLLRRFVAEGGLAREAGRIDRMLDSARLAGPIAPTLRPDPAYWVAEVAVETVVRSIIEGVLD